MFTGLLSTGCGGRSAGPALPTAQQASNKSPDSGRFEAYRASVELQTRRSAPAGSDVFVGSTYIVKRGTGTVVFSDRNVAMRTASTIGIRAGSQSSVFARADVTEVPKSFFVTAPKGRQTSTVHQICNPDGCPDPPPPPDPTPGPDGAYDSGDGVISSGSTTQAESIASTRSQPCTQTLTTNGYPGGVTMNYLGASTWQLQYKPGYPYFTGGTDTADITESVRLVDGTLIQTVSQALLENNKLNETNFTYSADPITTLKYVVIQVIEHPYPGDNLILGQADITCVGDNFTRVAPVPPPPNPPYPPVWWHPLPPA
ncbi:MAG TPA: hypothetical protein VGU66_06060 [Candidatus Elarobacter sp.]|nr:hypothetical protein [Candidatus Elarobacter sp.]